MSTTQTATDFFNEMLEDQLTGRPAAKNDYFDDLKGCKTFEELCRFVAKLDALPNHTAETSLCWRMARHQVDELIKNGVTLSTISPTNDKEIIKALMNGLKVIATPVSGFPTSEEDLVKIATRTLQKAKKLGLKIDP